MFRAWIAGGVVAVMIAVMVGTSGAQQPPPDDRSPARPAPVPKPAPAGPPPAVKDKEEEPEAPPRPERAAEPQRVPEELLPGGTPTAPGPRVFVGPDLFNPPAHQGWITVTPSFTLSGEYNDNIFLSSQSRRSDFIIGLTPGVTLTMQRPNYRVNAGYNVSGQIFLQENELSDFGQEQRFFANAFYQLSPRVSFNVSDDFTLSRGTNSLTSSGSSVGLQEAWRNTVTPTLRFQATPSTGLGAFASYTILRFKDSGTGSTDEDSDTYRVGAAVDHRLTQRLTGMLGVNVAYIDIASGEPAWTYTPTVGFGYDLTPTLRVSVNGGPTIIQRDGDTTIVPAVTASLTQAFKFGSLSVGYDKAVTAETVGLSDRHAIFASLVIPTLVRGLQLSFTPRYSIIDVDVSGTNASGDTGTVKTLTLDLQATYQIARSISLIGSYTFFQQTDNRTNVNQDIDQNRVFLGVQYAFPITLY